MAFVIVDPQRKFTLDVPDWNARASSAVDSINRFAREFRDRGLPVIFIHFDGESHCRYDGTDGDEWLEGIETSDSDTIVHKEHMNCFKQTDLEKVLRDAGADCVLFGGMLTEYCVISTYFAASEREFTPYLAKDALIPYNEDGNEAAQLICGTVPLEVLVRFISGQQPPMTMVERSHPEYEGAR